LYDIKINIKELREAKGLTQQELSDLTGIPRGRINAWEQRGVQPKINDWNILKRHLSNETILSKNTTYSLVNEEPEPYIIEKKQVENQNKIIENLSQVVRMQAEIIQKLIENK
jgi:transcriptional regulator with XRE-family HTH domain